MTARPSGSSGPKGRAILLWVGVGLAASLPVPQRTRPADAGGTPALPKSPPVFREAQAPRDDFSRRVIPKDDAGNEPQDAPVPYVPESPGGDG